MGTPRVEAYEERVTRLEAEVERLTGLVNELTRRCDQLEHAGVAPPSAEARPEVLGGPSLESEARLETAAAPLPADMGLPRIAAVSGRTFLILAGAFLLRTITEAGVWPTAVGAVSALAYGVILMLLANRAWARQMELDGWCYAGSSVVIVYPLLWEATTRMAVSPARVTAVLLAGVTTQGLWMAWRRGAGFFAGLVTLATLALSVILVYATGAIEAFTVIVLALGGATVWMAYLKGWRWPRWPAALLVDLLVLLAIDLAGDAGTITGRFSGISVAGTTALALALTVTYQGSFAWNALGRDQTASVFEILQGLAVLLVGLGGVVCLAPAIGIGAMALGIAGVILGTVSYAAAARSRHAGQRRNSYCYAWVGLALVILGAGHMSAPLIIPFVWLGLAGGCAFLGHRFDWTTLRVHCAVCCAAAAWKAGILAVAGKAWAATELQTWSALQVGLLAGIAICYAYLVSTRAKRQTEWTRQLPRAMVLLLLAVSVGGLVVTIAAEPFPGDISPQALAVVRTAVIALAALALAASGKHGKAKDMAWLVYPILAAGGIKLLAEDMRLGPLNIFLGFALYGLALLVAPRLLRKPVAPSAAPAPAEPPTH